MPIYEYECSKCGRFEAVQKADEKPLKKNPDCTCADCPKSAERVISAPAFHLKGTGWYKTDYSSGKTGGTASSSSSGDSSSSSSDSSSKKKKPAKASCGPSCGCH